MKLVTLECPHCNGELHIDDGIDSCYCQYCGRHIALQGMSDEAYKAKVRVMEMEQERYKMDLKAKKKDELRKNNKHILIGGFIILFFDILILVLVCNSIAAKHNESIAYCQKLEVEIEEALIAGEYDIALFKANQLYCDTGWSSKDAEIWDAKRESYIELINEKKREADIKDPDHAFAPASSGSFKGKNYSDVIDQLGAAGFINISVQASIEAANPSNKKDTVEHIMIGGKTEFTTEDYFSKDTPIIIYYYDDK